MKKDKNNKLNKKNLSIPENQFGVILEDIDSKMDLVLEGYEALDTKFTKRFAEVDEKLEVIDYKLDTHTKILMSHGKKIDLNAKKIDSNTKMIGSLVKKIDSNTKKIDSNTSMIGSLAKKIDSNTSMIGSLANNVEIIKKDTGFIKNSLKKKVDVDEFAFLESRVSLLEKEIHQRT